MNFLCSGLIRETMTSTLKIILQNEYVLFATMQIFILEPSFNWLKKIEKRRQELTGIEETKYGNNILKGQCNRVMKSSDIISNYRYGVVSCS